MTGREQSMLRNLVAWVSLGMMGAFAIPAGILIGVIVGIYTLADKMLVVLGREK